MKLGVISLGSKSSLMLIDAARNYFEEVDDIRLDLIEINFSGSKAEVLYDGKPLKGYDAIYAKGSFRYAPILSVLTTLLEDKCFMPLSRRSFNVAHDKLITQMELQKHNLPMPTTFLASNIEAAAVLLKKINYPVILKFPKGTHGKGVLFAESYSVATTILDALNALNQSFIIQEYVDTGGEDVRALVVGNKVVAAMKRKSVKGETRANLHLDGVAENFILDDHAKQICLKAAEAIGADICGVDYLEGSRGPKILEVNISPGLQGITQYSGKNIADIIAKYLLKKTVEFKGNKTGTDLLEDEKQIISKLDFRAGRIILPHLVTKLSDISEYDDMVINVGKKKIELKKL